MSLFAELKRRNVLRVAAAYLVLAWLLIQVAETIFPLFGFDNTPARIVVVVLAIGFIPAMIISWVFELTPEGLVKDEEVSRSQSISVKTGKKLDRIILIVLALALGYFALDKFVFSPERQAAKIEEARQHEREKAEQLATFIVDLGERLKSEADLETRALISAQASEYLQKLDPDMLSTETGIKVALAYRQIGQVSLLQGRSSDALEAFQQSRDILSTLIEKYPDDSGILFELGNAVFYVGDLHGLEGRYESAMEAMQNYHLLTRNLLETDPDNPDWIMEVANSHNNLAAYPIRNGMALDEDVQAHMAEAVRLAELVHKMKPADQAFTDGYSSILAWAADAQRQSCNLAVELDMRIRGTELAKASAQSDPANNDRKRSYAYRLSGLSTVEYRIGRLESSERNMALTIDLLQQLSAADPSNVVYSRDVVLRQFRLARIVGESGRLDSARSMMRKLESKLVPGVMPTDSAAFAFDEYLDFLIAYADVESRLGAKEIANQYLEKAMRLQLEESEPQEWDDFYKQRARLSRYLWWKQNGEVGLDGFPAYLESHQRSESKFRSCGEAYAAAREYVIENDMDNAASQAEYLMTKGYASPDFMRFCSHHNLCRTK